MNNLKLEVGKRYVRRNGEVSGVIDRGGSSIYPFYDPSARETYNEDGRYYSKEKSERDFISEYIEPQAEPVTEDLTRLRDEFAMAALTASLPLYRNGGGESDQKELAESCYGYADAMLAARGGAK